MLFPTNFQDSCDQIKKNACDDLLVVALIYFVIHVAAVMYVASIHNHTFAIQNFVVAERAHLLVYEFSGLGNEPHPVYTCNHHREKDLSMSKNRLLVAEYPILHELAVKNGECRYYEKRFIYVYHSDRQKEKMMTWKG